MNFDIFKVIQAKTCCYDCQVHQNLDDHDFDFRCHSTSNRIVYLVVAYDVFTPLQDIRRRKNVRL